jgi:hypothetical protein
MALGRTSKRTRQTKKIIIDTIFRLPQKNRRISALLNIDTEDNFIFQRLIIEINLFPKRMNRSGITVDKYRIYIYGRHQLPTVTIDFHKE